MARFHLNEGEPAIQSNVIGITHMTFKCSCGCGRQLTTGDRYWSVSYFWFHSQEAAANFLVAEAAADALRR